MNISENERFHVLAHKALAKQATPTEERELRALIADDPKLKEEMEHLGGEAAVLRELLPLLQDLEQPPRGIPRSLMDRLTKDVGEVLDANGKSKRDLRELLAKLEDWAHRQTGVSRDEVAALVALLRGSLLKEGEATLADVAILRAPEVSYTAPRLREEVTGRAREATARRQEELERRLVSLEARLEEAQEITSKCRNDVRGLLEIFERERGISEVTRRQDLNPLPKGNQ